MINNFFVLNLESKFCTLKFAIKAGFRYTLIESGNLSVMNIVRSYEDGLVANGVFVVDICRMDQSYNKINFSFAKR